MVTSFKLPTAGPVLLRGVSWAFYESLLREIGEQRLYVTYDRGNLEIMAPSPYHERYKTLIGRLIETLTLELNIPIVSGGSTTFKREDLDRGFEPDECYYIQHEREVREKFELDLLRDPPPDLAIEMDYTHHELDRESIYAAFRVPEIWRFDLRTLEVLSLQPDGRYAITGRSLAFPFLPMEKVEQFLLSLPTTDETSLVRKFRDWVRQDLAHPS
jgi:Uma2 family endonuclease